MSQSIFGNAPLSTAYGAVTGGTIDEESAQKLASTGAAAAMKYATEKALIAKKYVEDGDWTWKLAGMVSGCVMIFTSISGFMNSLFGLSPFMACLDIYICCFGILAICLEYKDQMMMKKYVDIIRREAHFLTTPAGRAAFYFFNGILIISKGGIVNLLAGGFLMLVGAVIYHSCRQAYSALNELHNKKYTEAYIISEFIKHDKDKSGLLDTKELGELCTALGFTLNHVELETALFILDKDGSGHINQDEFVEWWKETSPGLSYGYGV